MSTSSFVIVKHYQRWPTQPTTATTIPVHRLPGLTPVIILTPTSKPLLKTDAIAAVVLS